jgi:hypothetical protein
LWENLYLDDLGRFRFRFLSNFVLICVVLVFIVLIIGAKYLANRQQPVLCFSTEMEYTDRGGGPGLNCEAIWNKTQTDFKNTSLTWMNDQVQRHLYAAHVKIT